MNTSKLFQKAAAAVAMSLLAAAGVSAAGNETHASRHAVEIERMKPQPRPRLEAVFASLDERSSATASDRMRPNPRPRAGVVA